jgi:hypothetical protein
MMQMENLFKSQSPPVDSALSASHVASFQLA